MKGLECRKGLGYALTLLLLFTFTTPSVFAQQKYTILTTSEDWHYAMMASGLSASNFYPLYVMPSDALDKTVKDKLKKAVYVYIIGNEDVISASVEDELNDLRDRFEEGYESITPKRIGGKDIYEISTNLVDIWPEVNGIIVTRGDIFPDTLVATQLSAVKKAPILFTKSNEIPAVVLNKIKEKKVEVTIIGGPVAVSEGVENSIKNAGVNVKRIWGEDRFETSVKVAEEYIKEMSALKKEVETIEYIDGFTGDWANTFGARAPVLGEVILLAGSFSPEGGTLSNSVNNFIETHSEITKKIICIPEGTSPPADIKVDEIFETNTFSLSLLTADQVKVAGVIETQQDEGGS